MNPADADKFDFDPLDVSKTWPEDIFPLQQVGRMVLNRNPDNVFNGECSRSGAEPHLYVCATSIAVTQLQKMMQLP